MKELDLFAPAKLTTRHWKDDLAAGVLVAIVAIPLCLALSIASGVEPVHGVYTAIIAGIIVAMFGGSEFGVAGPAAAMTVLLFGAVAKFGFEGLMLAGLIAGIIQIVLGVTGIGRVVKFIPYAVIIGFTAGIGLLIMLGQIGNLTGIEMHAEGTFDQALILTTSVVKIHIPTLATGLSTLLLIFLIRRFFPRIPASFAALLIVSIVAAVLALPVRTIGPIPTGLPSFQLPPMDLKTAGDVFPTAFAIALLASIESLLSAVSADGMTGKKHSSSKELVGQGLANAVLPFFTAIPATGVIVRTATNIKNGAKTRLAAIFHSIIILLILLLLSPLASAIPIAALAGILIYTALHLISVNEMARLSKDSRGDAAVLASTVGATIFFDLPTAILMGFTLAGLAFMKKMSDAVEVKHVPQSTPSSDSTSLAPDIEGIARTYRISGALFFGSAYELEKISDETPEKATPALVLDLLQVDYIDSSSLAILAGLAERHKPKGEIYLAVTHQTVRKKILKSDVMKYVDPANVVPSVEEGLKKAREKYGKKA